MSNQERLLVVGLFYLGFAFYFGAEYFYHRERELGSFADGTPVIGGRLKDGTFYRSVIASGNVRKTLTRQLTRSWKTHNKENRQDLVALLLHGSAFSSRTWESIGTLEFLKSNMSLSSIAVDLPSYKDSKSVPVPKNKLAYLINMIFELEVFDDKRPGFLVQL
jgi:pimeloyl-ACP methyl ester carboxylesterase